MGLNISPHVFRSKDIHLSERSSGTLGAIFFVVECVMKRLRYKIGEVSKLLDTPKYTIRYWEEVFPWLNSMRVRGVRYYSPGEYEALKRIKELRADGLSINGIRKRAGLGPLAVEQRHRATPEYSIWSGMIQRCKNPDHVGYKNYGGRGIRVCDRWLYSFESFIEDVGERPGPEYSLDRIDNDGNYEPGNCRWADRKTQAANKRPRGLAIYL